MYVTISTPALHNYYAVSSTKLLEDSYDAVQLHSHETTSTLTTCLLTRKREVTSSGQ
jgi:hypothetical protein